MWSIFTNYKIWIIATKITKNYLIILGNRIDDLLQPGCLQKGYSNKRELRFMSWVNIWLRRVAKNLFTRKLES